MFTKITVTREKNDITISKVNSNKYMVYLNGVFTWNYYPNDKTMKFAGFRKASAAQKRKIDSLIKKL